MDILKINKQLDGVKLNSSVTLFAVSAFITEESSEALILDIFPIIASCRINYIFFVHLYVLSNLPLPGFDFSFPESRIYLLLNVKGKDIVA